MRRTAGSFLIALGTLLALWAASRALLREQPGSSAAPSSSAAKLARAGSTRLASLDAHPATAPAVRSEGDERKDAQGPVLVGFVLSEADGVPVADAWATLRAPLPLDMHPPFPQPIAEVGTDAAGRFALPWPTEAGTSVSVEAPYGWILTSATSVALPAQPSAEPVHFRARPLREARVELALVDQRTGEPIPHYVIGLRQGPTTSQLMQSDEHGDARSELLLAEGSYRVLLIDDQRMGNGGGALRQELMHDALPQDVPRELELPVGPTYLLDLRSPSDLSGKLLNASLALTDGSIELNDVLESSPVRAELLGGWPWVRFHARGVRWQIDQESELLLVVNDQARALHGEARVPASWGFHAAPVRIDLKPTGALEVEVVDADGRAVASAEVSLSAARNAYGTSLRTDRDGWMTFNSLPAKSYWLRVDHIAFQPAHVSANVSAGRTSRLRVKLEPARIAGTVEGRVIGGSRCASDKGFALRARLALVSIDGADRGFRLPLEFERSGDGVSATFRFEQVPAGEYALSMSDTDARLWWPQGQLVRPPAAALELREVDPGSLVGVAPRATETETGEALFDGWVWLRVEGCRAGLHPLGSPRPPLVQHGARFAWGLGAAGHVPRFGTEADLELDGAKLTAEVALARGCGLRMDVIGPDGEPREDVAVLAAGERVGTTDAVGSFFFERAALPDSLEVVSADGQSVSVLDACVEGEPVRVVRLERQ